MDRPAGTSEMDIAHREALLDRVERMTELPLMLLAFAMVPLLAAPLFWDLSPTSEAVTFALDMLIWTLFTADLVVKVAIAQRRFEYLRGHWLDVLVVLVPFARPLRIVRLVVYGSRTYRGAARLAHVDFLVVYAIGLVLIVATIVMSAERGKDSPIESFPDALWWAVATVTTVGYGDVVPVTDIGRAFAYVLMVGGIGIFGALTASFASILVRRGNTDRAVIESLVEEVGAMREEMARLRERLPQE